MFKGYKINMTKFYEYHNIFEDNCISNNIIFLVTPYNCFSIKLIQTKENKNKIKFLPYSYSIEVAILNLN